MTNETVAREPQVRRFRCATAACCDIGISADFNPYTDPRIAAMGLEHFRPAPLVIAAPDMLAALEAADEGLRIGGFQDIQSVRATVRAAIAKAKAGA